MTAQHRRLLLALLGGALAVLLLGGLAQGIPIGRRSLETVGLFLLFVLTCLLLDRCLPLRRGVQG
ncbi:MAG: hypothetical protein ACK56I_29040, partial [bacterium]